MPNFLKIAWVCLFISITFIQCKKEDTLSTNVPSMTCKINGQTWSASGSKAIAQMFQSQINISGQADDGTSITLSIESITTGTYNLVEKGLHVGTYATNNTISSYASNQGSDNLAKVVISDINTKDSTISGTFQFSGFRTSTGTKVVITDGVFTNVKLVSKPNFLQYIITGELYSSSNISTTVSSTSVEIIGWKDNYKNSILLHLQPNLFTGTINLGKPYAKNYGSYNKNNPSSIYHSTVGEVTISRYDKNAKIIEGSFWFGAEEIVSKEIVYISNGSFFIKY